MRLDDGTLWLAPTDLGVHLECPHATALGVAHSRGHGPSPRHGGPYEELIAAKGDAHERAYLHRLVEAGREVVKITLVAGDFQAAAGATERAMRDGAEVICQATFAREGWRGRADFLERVPVGTALGDWGYEAVDTKLARTEALPHHVLQLGMYSQWIEQVQGVAPVEMHLELGSGRRETIRVAEVAAYVRRAQARLREATTVAVPTEAYPCSHCSVCGFRAHCEAEWAERDHLSLVARIRRDHVEALRENGVQALRDLAHHDPTDAVKGMRDEVLAELCWQARLQERARRDQSLPFEARPREEGRGLGRLPAPDDGDVFLDLEGDPFWDPARELWFLFGLLVREENQWRYRAFWAHDPAQEQDAFAEVIDLISARLATRPGMHVYHYSPAEPSAFRRLAAQPSTREEQVDDLLRRQVFVDLYAVVRQALVIGAPGYGLKVTEKLAGFTRSSDVGSGSDAVLAYERWRLDHNQTRLDEVARYNEEDCQATLVLRDWLVAQRPAGTPWWEPAEDKPATDERRDAQVERDRVRQALGDGAAPGTADWLASELLEFHRRDQRPDWQQWHLRREASDAERLANPEALAGLLPTGEEPHPIRRSLAHRMTFPAQEHKFAGGVSALDGAEPHQSVTIGELDDERGILTIERAKERTDALPTALLRGKPLSTDTQRAAVLRFATSLLAGDGAYPHLERLLRRECPSLTALRAVIQTMDLDQQLAIAAALDRSTLVVQGPPGTGKTYLGGRMIVDLIARGNRVGLLATSHKAINNVLTEVVEAAEERHLTFRGVRKITDHADSPYLGSDMIKNEKDTVPCLGGDVQLVAGTQWLFSDARFDGTLDYLVIDEAGQMSLADALASGTSSRNMILLGDPQQLPQVSQAAHTPGTGSSVLEHMLGNDHATIAPTHGLFLDVTRRMHPDICRFISDEIYEGCLATDPTCAVQGTGAGTGIRFLPVSHEGNASASREEAETIRLEIDRLIRLNVTDHRGTSRPLQASDIMVVAPYNAHVRVLRQALPDAVQIGTVDKFQGQEAPVVFFSMATSTGDDMPRDAGFLFSRNRLNVAISRARCLAYLVCSPQLLDARARTVDDVRLVSTLCALVEEASRQRP